MDFRRNQEDMVGFNPQIRASAFSKPLLPPTASLLSSPRGVSAAGGGPGPGGVPARNNGIGNTATSDVFDPAPAVEHHHPLRANPDSDLAPAAVVSDGLLNAVAAATPTTLTGSSTSASTKDCSPPGEPAAKYRECLRNHAASLGGHVLDGCGDFMPGGAAAAGGGGGGDPLKCAACGCHRSFHRKEVEGEHGYFGRYGNGASPHQQAAGRSRLPLLLPPPPLHHHPPPQQWLARSPSGAAAAFGGNYSGSGGATTESSSEEHPGGTPHAAPGSASRKRFRSKFTTEQKKRMLGFAESVGWRMQKQDEAAVEQFCAEVGVRRQVLKVWMHNNKHSMRKQQQHYHDHPQQQHQDQQQQPLQIQEHQHHQQQPHRPQLQQQHQQHTQPQQPHTQTPQQQQQHTHTQTPQQQQQHTQPQQPYTQPPQQQQQQHTQPQQQQHRPQQQQHTQPQQQHPHHPQ